MAGIDAYKKHAYPVSLAGGLKGKCHHKVGPYANSKAAFADWVPGPMRCNGER